MYSVPPEGSGEANEEEQATRIRIVYGPFIDFYARKLTTACDFDVADIYAFTTIAYSTGKRIVELLRYDAMPVA